jgi:DNA-binding transcriptional ArsR family regulator
MSTHETAAADLLNQAVRQMPGVVVEPELSDATRLTIRSRDQSTRVQLRKWAPNALPDANGRVVWVLRNASSETHEKFRRDDQNFIDLSGSVRLRLPNLLVDRNDLEPVSAGSSESRNPFSDRTSSVPRALFERFSTGDSLSLRDVARHADLPLSTTSYAVRALEEMGVVESGRVGRTRAVRLKDRVGLIQQWSLKYTWKDNEMAAFDAPAGDLERFLRRLPRILNQYTWALTLQAGASLLVPHAVWNTVHLYVAAASVNDLARIGKSVGWQPSMEGRVVLLAPFYRESLWEGVRRVGQIPVVSDLQLVLDLWHYPVRGREQAELLLDRGQHEHA